ncbi:MAG: type 3-dehydroquinate dehydratase [Paenibacillus sp.]|jgi:3-dehydroquinate dehydratase|nr:type 3-dehydroquinate dehydratase [Paenibacillus sp.]
MSLLFSEQKFPMLVTSISDSNPDDVICTIRNAMLDGTHGYMIHLEKMAPEHVNPETLRRVFSYTCDKPIYTMNYRGKHSQKSDQQLIDEQIMAVKAGANMIDMMGDMFDRAPLELTRNPEAIEKQKQVIAQVHELGGEVLMSSHTWVYMTTDEVLAHAKELEARGADFIKIAMSVNSEEEMIDSIKTTSVVSKALSVPFLHICMGFHGKLHRAIGPLVGSCFALCVQKYTPAGHKEKVLLRAEKSVFDNIDCGVNRNVK